VRTQPQPTRRLLFLTAILTLSVLASSGVTAGAAPHLPKRRSATAAAAPTPTASQFFDSVGINIHNNYAGDTAYGQWPRIVAALESLGIGHLRDGLKAEPRAPGPVVMREQLDRLSLLRPSGMKVQFIAANPPLEHGSVDNLLRFVKTSLLDVTDGIEGPNEYDTAGDPAWIPKLRAYQAELFRKVNADPVLRDLPVTGPSTISDGNRRQLGDISASVDFGNLHPYTGGAPSSEAHLASELVSARQNSKTRPVRATEAGYHNVVGDDGQLGVSERAAAAYIPRTFLEHFAAGISRTYLYELIDEKPDPGRRDNEQHYGLLRNDFGVKPAFRALSRLLAVTRDRSVRRGVAVPSPALQGDTAGVRRLDLLKRDGSRLVVLWLESSTFDEHAGVSRSVTPRRLIVATDRPVAERRIVPLDPALPVLPARPEGTRTAVSLAATPVVVALGGADETPALTARLRAAAASR